MNNMFVMEKPLMAHIIGEIKELKLSRYEDYVRIVGIVSILEKTLTARAPENPAPEEVMNDG